MAVVDSEIMVKEFRANTLMELQRAVSNKRVDVIHSFEFDLSGVVIE